MDQRVDDIASAHAVLRAGTRHEHAAAERAPVMQALLGGTLGAAAYVSLLRGQYGLHAAWEMRHAGWIDGPLAAAGWRYQRRAERLALDLAEWGQPPETPSAPPADAAAAHGSVPDSMAPWGELYVIEGSALGGQILARLLTRRFPGHTHHFFHIGQEPVHGAWRHFQAMLDRQLPEPAHQHSALAGARTMFQNARHMLDEVKL